MRNRDAVLGLSGMEERSRIASLKRLVVLPEAYATCLSVIYTKNRMIALPRRRKNMIRRRCRPM